MSARGGNRHIVALSGGVGSGKSTVAEGLVSRHDAMHLSTRRLLQELAAEHSDEVASERRALQEYGDRLDTETNGRWVVEGLVRALRDESEDPHLIVVDSIRIKDQLEGLREAFSGEVVHVHLTAPRETLAKRYGDRTPEALSELPTYDAVVENLTESNIDELRRDADVVIDTERCTKDDVAARVSAALSLDADTRVRLVDVLIGAQYGSEGKGNIAFYLANEYDLLVRVGGPNAGHTVPLPTPYTHRMLPSGTRANDGAALLIGPGSTLAVPLLMNEIAECSVDSERLSIDPQAMIIEDDDVATEQALVKAIGSTGKGGGAAAARRIANRHHADGQTPVRLARDVPELRAYIRPAREVLDEAYRQGSRVLLEGTQGTDLSLYHGSYPYVTSRDTTTAGCLAEAGISPMRLRKVVLVTRSYPIRVMSPAEGDSGPMSAEITYEDLAERSGVDISELISTEKGSVSGNQRRIGEFDWAQLRRSAELNGATDIALTFADYLAVSNREARRYDQLTPDTIRFVEEIERVAGAPVSLIGTRFDVRSVIDRRRW